MAIEYRILGKGSKLPLKKSIMTIDLNSISFYQYINSNIKLGNFLFSVPIIRFINLIAFLYMFNRLRSVVDNNLLYSTTSFYDYFHSNPKYTHEIIPNLLFIVKQV